MLTLNGVKQLKSQLEDTLTLCDELLTTRQREQLFTSVADFRQSDVYQKRIPEDFYYFRSFDGYVDVFFDKRLSLYCVRLTGERVKKLAHPPKPAVYNPSKSRFECGNDFALALRTFAIIVGQLVQSTYLDQLDLF